MPDLNEIVKQCVAPVLLAAGFVAKSRRRWVLQFESGDQVLVVVRGESRDGLSVFVEWAYVPRILSEYLEEHGRRPDITVSAFSRGWSIPAEVRTRPEYYFGGQLWDFSSPERTEQLKPVLERELREKAVPFWWSLADLEVVLATAKASFSTSALYNMTEYGWYIILATVMFYRRPKDEVLSYLNRMAAVSEPNPIVPWLIDRLNGRVDKLADTMSQQSRSAVGKWGDAVLARWGGPLDGVEALDAVGDTVESSTSYGAWQLSMFTGGGVLAGGFDLLAQVTAETGAPVLSGYVMDGDCVDVRFFGLRSGAFRACIDREAMNGYYEDEVDDLFLPPVQAVERAVAWAEEAGLTPNPDLLLAAFTTIDQAEASFEDMIRSLVI